MSYFYKSVAKLSLFNDNNFSLNWHHFLATNFNFFKKKLNLTVPKFGLQFNFVHH